MDTVSTFVMLMASFNVALTAPTAASMAVLLRGAILSVRARTVAGCLRAAWPWAGKGWQTYGNVLRRAEFSMMSLARILFGLILGLVPEDAPIYLSVDESLVRRWGPYVPAVGMHRDPVSSSRGRNAPTPGHKWVVLSVVLRLPYMGRPVALPVLSALYTPSNPPKRNRRGPTYRRHRTISELALLLVRILVRWAPRRHFIITGDGAYATHRLARKLRPESRHRALRRVSLVSRFYFDAAIYAEPPTYQGTGRPPVKGQKLPNPQEVTDEADPEQWQRAVVQWYGREQKLVWLLSDTALWYKAGQGAKRIRWVVVRLPEEERRDEVFFSTDPALSPARIVEAFVRRWSLETTFQEVREHLGLETLRNWSEKAVKRSVPLLLGLYSLVVIWFELHVEQPESVLVQWPWYEKQHVTFSDMLDAARADIMSELLFERPHSDPCEHKVQGFHSLFPKTYRCTKSRAA